MNRILLIAVTAVMAFSSCQSSKVNIAGRFVGLDADMVYLEQSTPLEQAIIDSVALNEEGEFKLQINNVAQTPSLYYICYNNERLPLLLSGGDNICGNDHKQNKIISNSTSRLKTEKCCFLLTECARGCFYG